MQIPIHAESSIDKDLQLPLTPGNNVLTPLAFEIPSSFENSPAVSFGDLPSIFVVTPILSPLNAHKNCHESFCSMHDDHRTTSPSTRLRKLQQSFIWMAVLAFQKCSSSTRIGLTTLFIPAKHSNTRRNAVSSLPTLELAYKAPINLSKDKHKDLISLVDLGIIPSQYGHYFRSLPYSNDNDIENNSEEN
ncbi:hypothetical protein ACJJTC_014111 [Scirpophaga incertulas]